MNTDEKNAERKLAQLKTILNRKQANGYAGLEHQLIANNSGLDKKLRQLRSLY